jgi:aminomethyltransferase
LTDVLRTPLHALHLELGARMVPFAGYDMPVQYPAGIIAEHLHVRAQAGLFDVSHMGQLRLSGADAAAALETLVPADIAGLAAGRQRYTFFTASNGGILDDLMVGNDAGQLVLVVNAVRKAFDLARLQSSLAARCDVGPLEERALLALQGPLAAEVMARLCPLAAAFAFMGAARVTLGGTACFVSRSGYTGEDGFEISAAAGDAERLARLLLAQEGVAPAGLGARDSLRLEAGLPLYRHELDESTTPIEAGLEWAIPKVRRPGGARAGGFPGEQAIFAQLATGASRRRVGILPEGRAPVREGEALHDAEGRAVGAITSGGFGASVDGPVAMGYVEPRCVAPGTLLTALPRGKPRVCRVTPLPFFPHRYYRGAGQ